MNRRLTGLILLGLILVGCSEDEIPPPEIEVFSGELVVTDFRPPPMYPLYDTDRVVLTVEGSTYDLDHVHNVYNPIKLCNTEGRALGFGTNVLTLIPTVIHYGNCDVLRIPQGEFKSIFRGDSLYLGPDTQVFTTTFTDTMIYHFRLTK